jgi:hypothetical protein
MIFIFAPWFFVSKKTFANKGKIYPSPFCLLAVAARLSNLARDSSAFSHSKTSQGGFSQRKFHCGR